MNGVILNSWFANKFVRHSRKALQDLGLPSKAFLMLDNAPSHPDLEVLTSDYQAFYATEYFFNSADGPRHIVKRPVIP